MLGQAQRHPPFGGVAGQAHVPPFEEVGQDSSVVAETVGLGGEPPGVGQRVGAERHADLGGVLPHQWVPRPVLGVLEEDPGDVVGVVAHRPLAGVRPAVGAAPVAVGDQGVAVVAEPVDLDPVVLDRPPRHRQEVIHEVGAGRDPQTTGAGHAVLVHVDRTQLEAGDGRVDQALVGTAVVDGRHPLPDHLLQLRHEEERLVLDALAPAVDIGALVAGQRLQQPLAQGAEEPFHGRLVRRRVRPGRLDRDAQAGADAQHVG